MKITKVTDRHVVFTVLENAKGGFVNMGLILGKRHNFIIDTGMGISNVEAILKYIADNHEVKPIIAINTHAHWDHVLGNETLKGGLIISHVLCRRMMEEHWGDIEEHIQKTREYFDEKLYKCLPNLVFEGNLDFSEEGISIFHTPGHSDDGISVYDAVDKVLYVGDNFGIFDGVAHLWAENTRADQSIIEIYKGYDFDICIPSHSEPQRGDVIGLLEVALAKAKSDGK